MITEKKDYYNIYYYMLLFSFVFDKVKEIKSIIAFDL